MERRSKRALALSGGGFPGFLFEIGALTALDDVFEDGFTVNDFDLYVGASAGAAAAALAANGVKPSDIFKANLSGERPYYFEHRDICAPAMGEGVMTIFRLVRQLSPLLRWYVRNWRESSLIDLLEKAQDSLPIGLYKLEPFARYLEAAFVARGLSNSFEGLAKELYVPAIELDSGESVVFGDEGHRSVPISRAIIASSAAPIYFCPVRIGGRDYIDAGVGRIAFFEIAIQKGADFMVIINPSAHIRDDTAGRALRGAGAHPVRRPHRGFLSIGDQATRINLEARFSQALRLARYEHPEQECFVISPKLTDTVVFGRSFLSFRDRIHLLRSGYLSVVKAVTVGFSRLHELFARHGISLSQARGKERLRTRIKQLAVAA